MTNMTFNADRLIEGINAALVAAEVIDQKSIVSLSSIAMLADTARELVVDGAFRSKSAIVDTHSKLTENGMDRAEADIVVELGLQIGKAVNSALMNAAGVFSGTAKTFRSTRACISVDDAGDFDDELLPLTFGDDEIDEDYADQGMIWNDAAKECQAAA